jgi:hypothetical protein
LSRWDESGLLERSARGHERDDETVVGTGANYFIVEKKNPG